MQTRDAWDAIDGWFQCNDSSCWLLGHRYHPWTCTSEKEGRFPAKPGPKQQETERKRTPESTENGVCGVSQLSRDQNEKKEHMGAQKEEGGVGPS